MSLQLMGVCHAAVPHTLFKGGTPEELEQALMKVNSLEEVRAVHKVLVEDPSTSDDLGWIWLYVADSRMTELQWWKLQLLWAARHPLAMRTIVIPMELHRAFYSRVGDLRRRYSCLQKYTREQGTA